MEDPMPWIFLEGDLDDGGDAAMPSSKDGGREACYVSVRDVEDGSLVWRRDACSTSSTRTTRRRPHRPRYASVTTQVWEKRDDDEEWIGSIIVTMDDRGVIRRWNATDGSSLDIDRRPFRDTIPDDSASSSHPRLVDLSVSSSTPLFPSRDLHPSKVRTNIDTPLLEEVVSSQKRRPPGGQPRQPQRVQTTTPHTYQCIHHCQGETSFIVVLINDDLRLTIIIFWRRRKITCFCSDPSPV